MSGPVNLLDAFPFGAPGLSVKVGGQKKMGTGGQETAPVEVKLAGQMDMEGARRRRRHTKKGGQAAMEGARRRRRHTKKGGQEGARRRHRSRKH